MCGIIAAASNRNVGKLLVQGLHKMEYRGYDSAGIALHQTDQIAHLRTLGKVKLLEEKMIAEKPKVSLALLTQDGLLTVNHRKKMHIHTCQTKGFILFTME